MKRRWPTDEELDELRSEEEARAEEHSDDPDPICVCGEPGYACCCYELAEAIGFWSDGTQFTYPEESRNAHETQAEAEG